MMPGLITGWKDIAEFLGVSEKTARRYEKTRDLPVIRIIDNGPVKAIESELIEWLKEDRQSA